MAAMAHCWDWCRLWDRRCCCAAPLPCAPGARSSSPWWPVEGREGHAGHFAHRCRTIGKHRLESGSQSTTHHVGEAVQDAQTVGLGPRHRAELEEEFWLQPRSDLPCLDHSADSKKDDIRYRIEFENDFFYPTSTGKRLTRKPLGRIPKSPCSAHRRGDP